MEALLKPVTSLGAGHLARKRDQVNRKVRSPSGLEGIERTISAYVETAPEPRYCLEEWFCE